MFLGVALALASPCKAQVNVTHFDEARWKAAEVGSAVSIRGAMVEDLVRNRHLRRLQRGAIHALLGKPMPYELTPENEDWYVIEERYHNESDHFETPCLQRHLVIEYVSRTQAVASLSIDTAADAPGTKKVRTTRVFIK